MRTVVPTRIPRTVAIRYQILGEVKSTVRLPKSASLAASRVVVAGRRCMIGRHDQLVLWLSLVLLVAPLKGDEATSNQSKVAAAPAMVVERLGDEAARAIAEFYAYDATIPLEA